MIKNKAGKTMHSTQKFLPISPLLHCPGVRASAMRQLVWPLSAMWLLALPAWAETHFTELSLEELMEVPVDSNAVNILEGHIR